MKDYNQPERFDMWGFTEELQTLMEYRAKYYALQVRYEDLDNRFNELLNGTLEHNQVMSASILSLCLHSGGSAEEKA